MHMIWFNWQWFIKEIKKTTNLRISTYQIWIKSRKIFNLNNEIKVSIYSINRSARHKIIFEKINFKTEQFYAIYYLNQFNVCRIICE